ncbi:MAG: MotE family protein [Paracoccus sp. (in: a-proteobacteria)]|uniref:MotE family protein n=1 Tax=Paracoccus sp. TaxID=267 RepID=UPI0040594EDA
MSRPLLPVLTLMFALPAAALLSRGQDIASSFAAVAAAPEDLLEGCRDVPEAVALAEELRDRALRIERYMQDIDARKAELATAEATLSERLKELRAQKDNLGAVRAGDTEAVRTDIDRLIAVYDQMKPAEAAAVLTNLPADFAAEILMRVRPETGARIIAAVEPRQAALLTAQMGARSVRTP